MSCAMFEIEVTEPLRRLSLNDDQTGLDIVMRRKGRPVGFWQDSPAGKRTLQPSGNRPADPRRGGSDLARGSNPGRNGTAAHRDIAFRDHRHMHQGSSQRPGGSSEVVAGIPWPQRPGGTPSGRLW